MGERPPSNYRQFADEGDMMRKMESFYNKVVGVLSRYGYIEGSYTDFNVQQFIKTYSRPSSWVLDHQGEVKITGEYFTTETATMGDTDPNPIVIATW